MSGPNRSQAVMAQRKEPADSLDFFPTPPWAVRGFVEELGRTEALGRRSVWEPSCGAGHMVVPLLEVFGAVRASDVHDYGWGHVVHDFLMPTPEPAVDWIVTNPPFRLGVEFALRALDLARLRVALLVRTAFLEGQDRHARLFRPHPPSLVLQYVERVPMLKGRYDPAVSTATSYCWLVWDLRRITPTELGWIPPCRERLFRPEDVTIGAIGGAP